MKMTRAVKMLSENLMPCAHGITDMLRKISGCPEPSFILAVEVDGVTQFVANVDRPSSIRILHELTERMESGDDNLPLHLDVNKKGFQ